MLNNFIYAQTKDLFLEKLNAGEVLDEAIVFIEDTKEIWNHGHYFAGESIDPNTYATKEELDEIKWLIPITYQELVNLRNSNELTPGTQYRIIDYTTTTVQTDTQSAGHQFDVIVTANSTNTLNENARAIQHEGDTYFANSNLAAWQIWYCLDNNTDKFMWADTTNGKGVIYRMIDEWNNDVPYDFKNILFKRYKTTSSDEHLVDKTEIDDYLGIKQIIQWNPMPSMLTITSEDDYIWCYTFHSRIDNTDSSIVGNAYYNKISITKVTSTITQFLNNIVFRLNKHLVSQIFHDDCCDMTFVLSMNACWNNVFKYGSHSNVIVITTNYYAVTFESECINSVIVSPGFYYNHIYEKFDSNIITNTFSYNHVGRVCRYNVFKGKVSQSTFGDQFRYNVLNEGTSGISLSTIGGYCEHNVFTDIKNCIIAQRCEYNNIHYLTASQIGIGFRYNTFKSGNTTSSADRPHIQGCKFGDYIWYNNFYNTDTSTTPIKCLNVQSYLQGSASAYNNIEVPVGMNGEIKVAKNSNGEIKVYNEADLIA